ncbi:MAG: hypothetical protein Fur003_3570 [Candidatus Dojkabacteria bacterium]
MKLKKLNQIQIYVIVFLIISVLSVSLSLLFEKDNEILKNKDSNASDNDEKEKESLEPKSAPRIINIPPNTAYIGKRYEFPFKVTDKDTDISEISMELKEAPAWLIISGYEISGIPTEEATNQKVVVLLSDGEHNVEETFYINVIAEPLDE